METFGVNKDDSIRSNKKLEKEKKFKKILVYRFIHVTVNDKPWDIW